MTADLEQRDENISRMNKEKKQLEQVNQQTLEDLQAMEDKSNHLEKLKTKLEQQIEDVSKLYCNCNDIFIHHIVLARRPHRDLSVFGSSCHLPNCLPHAAMTSHCPFYWGTSSNSEIVNTNLFIAFGLTWPGITPKFTLNR